MGPPAAVAATRRAVRASLDLAPGSVVAVACSGGADSLALLAAAAFEAPRAGLGVLALTVDHGLQPGSAAQAKAVVAAAAALGVPRAEILPVSVGVAGGPEAAAREARLAALSTAAARHGAPAVLLGHTLDDQAETVLLRLARGSGARSLAGMAPRSGEWRRPFLGLRRATTQAACAALALQPWSDPHNADPAYARARVRGQALPALEAALGPGVAEALARSARLLRADADALEQWASRARGSGGLAVAALAALPDAVRWRVLRQALVEAGVPAGALTAEHVLAASALVTDWHGQKAVSLPGGHCVRRRYGTLVVLPPPDH